MEDHLKANNKTGLVLLIDARDNSLLETVTKEDTAAEIVGKIERHLQVARMEQEILRIGKELRSE